MEGEGGLGGERKILTKVNILTVKQMRLSPSSRDGELCQFMAEIFDLSSGFSYDQRAACLDKQPGF